MTTDEVIGHIQNALLKAHFGSPPIPLRSNKPPKEIWLSPAAYDALRADDRYPMGFPGEQETFWGLPIRVHYNQEDPAIVFVD